MAFQSLEDAVFNGNNLAEPIEYVAEKGTPNELFSDRHGSRISLLHYMIMVKSDKGVSVMLAVGADPNLQSSDGETPLYMAIIEDSLDIVKLLVEKGADINARGELGNTPLHMALTGGHKEIARYLVDHGADKDAVNDLGISPRQIELFDYLC